MINTGSVRDLPTYNDSINVLLTGITGFVGHHVFAHLMQHTAWNVVGMYRNSVAGDFRRIDEILSTHPEWSDRLTMFHHDLRDPIYPRIRRSLPPLDVVLHVGANSHVDRSISDPMSFVKDNVLGTLHLLQTCRMRTPDLFVYFSTDEVFGNAPDGVDHTEEFPHRPRNPYAASKAAAEDFCYAYQVTYDIPLVVTNTMNIIGERQDPEKYVPKIMNHVLRGETVSIHSHPDRVRAGQRHYLHARNAAAALLFVIQHGVVGERYNVVGEEEIDNLTLARLVHEYMDTDLPLHYELVDFHTSRPGHDLRYSLDDSRLRGLGYQHPVSFRDSLRTSVEWTMNNQRWL